MGILRPLTIPVLVFSTWKLKLALMTSLRATRRTRNSPTRFLPSARTGSRFSGTTKTAERSAIIALPQLPDMDPVTMRLLALSSSSQVIRVVDMLLLPLLLLQLLPHTLAMATAIRVMVPIKLLNQQPAHQLSLRLLQILRLPPLILSPIVTPMVQLATVKPPLHPLTKDMDTTSNKSINSQQQHLNLRSLIPASHHTVATVKDLDTRNSVPKVIAVVSIPAAPTEQARRMLFVQNIRAQQAIT